jgi:hypothetical protein
MRVDQDGAMHCEARTGETPVPRVVGIYRRVLPEGLAGTHLERRTVCSLYVKALSAKANPRPAAYMEALFREAHPDGHFFDASGDQGWTDALDADDQVVLLYPDPLGLGFGTTERAVLRRSHRTPAVLNGRRRSFLLDAPTRRSLQLRRALSWSMAPELVLTVVMLVASPVLYVLDAARGRT